MMPRNVRPHWYGRILQDGEFEQVNLSPAIVARLVELAKERVRVASEHHCCFCHLPLSEALHPRSATARPMPAMTAS